MPLFNKMKYLFLFAGLLGLNLIFWHSEPARAESPQQIKNEQDLIRESMVNISRQLGVTCTTCHHLDNFRDRALPAYKTAFEHLKIVQSLKEQGFNGRKGSGPLADCYMCHRGKLKPDFQEPVNPLLEKESPKKKE
jgi:hypothetical protein